jgi:3-hydroxyisobutyrate dehydrogenase-like beta-hydroxyacid dehydrogenase
MVAVGLIGLGEIGGAMARRLLACGVPVVAHDIDPSRAQQLPGAVVVASAGEVARRSDGPILVNVQYLEQVYEVWEKGDGLAGHVVGRTVVITGTYGEVPVQELAATVAAAGGEVLDAPHTGSYPAVEAGTLTFFLGGSDAAIEAARIAVDTIGGAVHVIGDRPGLGQVMKLVNAIGLAFNAISICEMEKIAEASGVDPGKAIRWVDECSASSWLSRRMPDIAKLMVEHNVDNLEKDLRAVLAPAAPTAGLLPVTAAMLEHFRESWLTRSF